MSSTKRWIGNAALVTDLWTISAPSGTVVSQTYSVTINGKSVNYIAGGSDTASVILAGLQAALSSLSPAPPPEFQELTWTALPAGGPYTSVTGTQNTPGVPTVITSSTTGAAGGFTSTNTTQATGPNDFTNSQNYSNGLAPVNGDTIVFDNGSVNCLYNLGTSLTGVTLYVNPGYSGQIGLPLINTNGVNSYFEYRATNLTLAGGTAIINSPNVTRCNLAFGANTANVQVLNTSSQRPIANTPVCLITGGNGSSILDISKGDVGVAYYIGTTSTFVTIATAYVSQPLSDVNLIVGLGATLTTVTKNGGNVTLRCNATTVSQDLAGGILTLTDTAAATTLNASGGTVNWSSSSTIGTINLYGQSTLNCNADPRTKTATNPINVFSNQVSVIDDQKSINSGTLSINGNGCTSFSVSHGTITTAVYT